MNQKSRKRISNVPTKDFFENPIDIGDIVLAAQHSRYIVGKVVSLCEGSIEITCERETSNRKKWDRKTQSWVQGTTTSVRNTISWQNRIGLGYIKEALSKHNGTKRIYIFRGTYQEIAVDIINLTKLNIYHENP